VNRRELVSMFSKKELMRSAKHANFGRAVTTRQKSKQQTGGAKRRGDTAELVKQTGTKVQTVAENEGADSRGERSDQAAFLQESLDSGARCETRELALGTSGEGEQTVVQKARSRRNSGACLWGRRVCAIDGPRARGLYCVITVVWSLDDQL